jgi:hypothetical protein
MVKGCGEIVRVPGWKVGLGTARSVSDGQRDA